ncbi:RHBL1 protein, partial [Polypterus senegalus]
MDRSSLFKLIQEQLDPENTGFIAVENFTNLVEHHELQLDPSKLEMLFALVQSNEEGQVCYQELIELLSSKRSSSFRKAIANGRRTLQREILLDETGLGIYKRFVRYVAYEILPCENDRRWYFHQNRFCPPPVFMAVITVVQIIVFICYGAKLNKWVLQTYHPDFMKSPLVYHPGHRAQVWRFFTYIFMHVGLEQLGFNALLQLVIGVPLEMVHGLVRISLLYIAGVLAENGLELAEATARELANKLEMPSEDVAFPAVTSLRRRQKKRHFNYEVRDELITDPKEKFRTEFFLALLDQAIMSMNERFDQMKQHFDNFGFLQNYQLISPMDDNTLMKYSTDLKIALTDSKNNESDIDSHALCSEICMFANLVPSNSTAMQALEYLFEKE